MRNPNRVYLSDVIQAWLCQDSTNTFHLQMGNGKLPYHKGLIRKVSAAFAVLTGRAGAYIYDKENI